MAVGETTTITADGDPYLEITVTEPSQHMSYGSGYSIDKPKKGYIFLRVYAAKPKIIGVLGSTSGPLDFR